MTEPEEGDVRYNSKTYLWERYRKGEWTPIVAPAPHEPLRVYGP